jgi:hypothetical protein
MAKKVVNQVVIKDEELTPTTLGVYSNKTKSPVGLVFLIFVFLGLAIFLPNISSYIDKFTNKGDDTAPVVVDDGNNDKDDNPDPDDGKIIEIVKYKIASDTIIDTDDYTISNIALNGNMLSLSILNKKSDNLYLDDYYFELYSDENTFLERVKVGEDTLSSNSSKNFTYTINSTPTQLSFVVKTEDDYPVVNLKYDSNQEAKISCSKGIEKYEYIFINDVLVAVDYTLSASNINDPNYSTELMQKQTQANRLNSLEGISSNLLSSANGYSYTVSVDLSEANISELNDRNYFRNKASAKEVKFKSEARGFKCN